MLECWTKERFHGENLQMISNLLSSNERPTKRRGYVRTRLNTIDRTYTYTCNSRELFSTHVRKLLHDARVRLDANILIAKEMDANIQLPTLLMGMRTR